MLLISLSVFVTGVQANFFKSQVFCFTVIFRFAQQSWKGVHACRLVLSCEVIQTLCIGFLLLYNKLPQTQGLKTMLIYQPINNYVGQKYRHSIAGFSAQCLPMKNSRYCPGYTSFWRLWGFCFQVHPCRWQHLLPS